MLRKEVKHETLEISKLPLFLNSFLNLIVESLQIIKVPSTTDMMEIKMHIPVRWNGHIQHISYTLYANVNPWEKGNNFISCNIRSQ